MLQVSWDHGVVLYWSTVISSFCPGEFSTQTPLIWGSFETKLMVAYTVIYLASVTIELIRNKYEP